MVIASAFVQLKASDEKEIKTKGLVRDGILGAIFTTIVWVLSPESMNKVFDGLKSIGGDAAEIVKKTGGHTEFDVQVGPVGF